MATESEIENYSELLNESTLTVLKNIKNTYNEQILNAKNTLEKTSFEGWEDEVSNKFKQHFEQLKIDYSTIENDVGNGSNLDTLIKLVEDLKSKCVDYKDYLKEYNSISTEIYFSDSDLMKEYYDYKDKKISYSSLSQSVKYAIERSKNKENRKRELKGLIESCSSSIDTTLTNIKSITFNGTFEDTSGLSSAFSEEIGSKNKEHLTSEELIEQFKISKGKKDDLIAKLKEIDYQSLDAEAQINALVPEAYDILREYSDASFLLYLKGEIPYNEYMTLSNIETMRVTEDFRYGSIYDILYNYSNSSNDNLVNNWSNQNDQYRTFAERLKNNGCQSEEFLQNVPTLSSFHNEGTIIDYNSKETASQYAVASLVELLENGYTGDVIQDYENTTITMFNNKAGDQYWGNGYIDIAKNIINTNYLKYNENHGAFNSSSKTTK